MARRGDLAFTGSGEFIVGTRPQISQPEPEMGFEPMTCALRVRCSTTELPGRLSKAKVGRFSRTGAGLVIVGATGTAQARQASRGRHQVG